MRVISSIFRQQQLRHGLPVLAEKFFVDVHQNALPYGGKRLIFWDCIRLGGEIHFADTGGDSSRSHENNFLAGVVQVSDFANQMVNAVQIQLAGAVA